MNGLIEAVATPVNELMTVTSQMAVNDFSRSMVSEIPAHGMTSRTAPTRCTGRWPGFRKYWPHISHGSLVDLAGLKKVGQRSEQRPVDTRFCKSDGGYPEPGGGYGHAVEGRGGRQAGPPGRMLTGTKATSAKLSRESTAPWTQ